MDGMADSWACSENQKTDESKISLPGIGNPLERGPWCGILEEGKGTVRAGPDNGTSRRAWDAERRTDII